MSEEKLGRFGHHPDPAIDFETEVHDIECEVYHHKVGFEHGTPPLSALADRIFKAMTFRVGAVETAVLAKQRLRELEKEVAAFAASPVNARQEEPFAWAYRWRDNEPWELQFGKPSAPGVVGTPLYTTPRPEPELVAALRAAKADLEEAAHALGVNTLRILSLAKIDAALAHHNAALALPTAGVGVKEGEPVEDTCFADRALPIMAMSSDVESNRVLKLHFRRPVTNDDRKTLVDMMNAYKAGVGGRSPLKEGA